MSFWAHGRREGEEEGEGEVREEEEEGRGHPTYQRHLHSVAREFKSNHSETPLIPTIFRQWDSLFQTTFRQRYSERDCILSLIT